jgi:hypothetical protein
MNQIQGQARTRWSTRVRQTQAHGGPSNADTPTHIEERIRKIWSSFELYVDGSERPL